MFVIPPGTLGDDSIKKPVKVWLNELGDIEKNCLEQIIHTANLPFLHSHVAIMPDTHMGYGMPIGGVIATDNVVIPNAVGVDIGCVDGDTEYLTVNGWRKISDYSGEEIMVFDLNTEIAKLETPINYIKALCTEFNYIRIKYGVDQMLDDDHKVLMYRYSKTNKSFNNPVICLSKDLVERHNRLKLGVREKFLTTFRPKINTEINMSDEQIRVMVMCMADGCFTRNTTWCNFHFRKMRKIERAKKLLSDANIEYALEPTDHRTTSLRFYAPINEKRVGYFWQASLEQLRVIVDEVLHWDGNLKDRVFFSRYKEDADFIQYACSALGIRATITTDYRDSGIDYRVIFSDNKYVGIAGSPKTPITTVKSKDGYKYCFTTSTGFWVMRRNDDIVVTGNCGMITTKLSGITMDEIMPRREEIVHQILRAVPTGYNHRKEPLVDDVTLHNHLIEKAKHCKYRESTPTPVLNEQFGRISRQLGTLGSNNHFIEIQKDENNNPWLMIHSGSRNFGKQVADYYNKVAKALNDKYYSQVPPEWQLAFLPRGEEFFNMYWYEMHLALEFALWNRNCMLEESVKAIENLFNKYIKQEEYVNIHHNYCSLENHFGKNVFVHRKGATLAKEGTMGIIPGSMGTKSYIVRGKGCADSFCSCSHGAGRVLGRVAAKKKYTAEKVLDYYREIDIVIGKIKKKDIAEECDWSYKNIGDVMKNQVDLVDIVHELTPVAVVKG